MKTPFLFLLASFAFLILTINLASANSEESKCEGGASNSAEAKCRKDKAPELCEKNHNKGSSSDSDSDSGEGDSDSDSGSDDDGDGNSDSDSGNSGDSKDDWDSLPDEDKPTGSPATPHTPASPPTKRYRHNRYHCDFIDSVRNMSLELNVDQRDRLEFCIRKVEVFMRHSSSEIVKKTAIAAHKFKQCIKKEYDIFILISFEKILSWGTVFDITYVSIDLQADFVDLVITLDDDDDCPLFEAMRNATKDDAEKSSYVLVLIEELREVLLDVSLSLGQKKAKLYDKFKAFLELHVEWEEFFLEIEIEGLGPLGSLVEVCKGHKKSLSLSVVISGSSDSDCSLCSALSEAVANTSFSISVRNQIKNFHDKIVNYFTTTTDIELRLTYISQQYWQMILMEPFVIKIMSLISLKNKSTGEEWGLFYDIKWVSQFCKNSGLCGCLKCGMTPSPVSTTLLPTTVPPANCGSRGNLIAVTAQNTTIFTDVLTETYNSWNSSMRLGFNTCFNQVRKAIWDNVSFPTVSVKLSEIVRVLIQYGNTSAEKKRILFDVVIVKWNGKIGQFCDCQTSG